MIERPHDKTGDRYEYFTCSGRRRKTTNCTRSAILAERVESKIERTYQRNSLTETQARQARSRTPQTRPSPLRRHDPPRPPQERTRPHPRQPRPDHHPTRQPHQHLHLRPGRTRPTHRTPGRPRRPLHQVRTSRTTHPQPGPVQPHHHRRRTRHLHTRADHSQRPRPHQHRCPGRSHSRNKTAPPSGGASFNFLILRGAKGIRTPDLFHAMEARYQLRHSPK